MMNNENSSTKQTQIIEAIDNNPELMTELRTLFSKLIPERPETNTEEEIMRAERANRSDDDYAEMD
jgi:hypothetical protein